MATIKSIEEKARRYDKALERANKLKETCDSNAVVGWMEYIFPELKESGDIRKRIIDALHGDVLEMGEIKKAIAWLEKQGNLMKALQISNAEIGELIEKNYYLKEQLEKQGEHANFLSKIQVGDKVTRNEDGVLVNISQLNRVAKKRKNQGNNMGISEATKKKLEDNLNKALEKETPESCNEFLDKQSEQKPIKKHNACKFCEDRYGCVSPCPMKLIEEEKPNDKVKPKFHEGDWVIGRATNNEPRQITEIKEEGYKTTYGGWIGFSFEEDMRLWTIQDAKAGDVLVSESTCGLGTWYCIFKSLDGDESMTVYCYLARDGRFETKKELCFDKDPYNTKPATKEQRDQLEKAMANAGYIFDFEKKELKKIEQKHVIEMKSAEESLDIDSETYSKIVDECIYGEQKSAAWSEEDDKKAERIIRLLYEAYDINCINGSIDWLRTLKDRVLPQPKQEWSEDTQQWIDAIIFDYESWYDADKDHRTTIQAKINILKSLKHQSTWKPSDEQMAVLNEVIDYAANSELQHWSNFIYTLLKSLREQLKKLREE